MIKTNNNKILNINKNRIFGGNELLLRSNKETQLSGTDVERWSDIKNGWVFKAPSGNEPTLDATEEAVEFTASSSQYLVGNKKFDNSKPFTFSAWVKCKSASVTYYAISNRDGGYSDGIAVIKESTGGLKFDMHSGSSQGINRYNTTITGQNTTDWIHILAIYDGSTLSVYSNGYVRSVFSITVNSSTVSDASIWVGRMKYFANYLDGYVDDINIKHEYNETLVNWTGSALKYAGGTQVFTPPPRSGSRKPILQLQGNTLINQKILLDSSNNVLQWSDVRNKRFFTGTNVPNYNFTEQAVEFTSASSEKLEGNDWFDYSKPFTLSFWMKPKTYAADFMPITQRDYYADSNNLWFIWYQASIDYLDMRIRFSGSYGTNRLQSQTGLLDGGWHHYMYVFDGISLTQFWDGKCTKITSYASVSSPNNYPIRIGAAKSSFYFNGYIDDIQLHEGYNPNFVGWNGATLFTAKQQVFTPKPRNFPNL